MYVNFYYAARPHNAALNKATMATSVLDDNEPSRAVDGNLNPSLANGSCFASQLSEETSLTVELGDNYMIHTISLTNAQSDDAADDYGNN